MARNIRFFLISLILSLGLSFTQTTKTEASGITLHMFMVDHAIAKIKDKSFKQFLKNNWHTLQNGVMFPDSGYASKVKYGEFAHWAPFLNTFGGYLDETCSWPLDLRCETLFAYFLGSLAHTLGDINFDRYFVTAVAQQSFKGNMGDAQNYTDFGLDMLAIWDYDRGRIMPYKWAPTDEMAIVLSRTEIPTSSADIALGTNLLYAGILAERPGSIFTYVYYALRSRWAYQNYLRAKGGVFDSGRIIAEVWQQVWDTVMRDRRFVGLTRFHNQGGWPNVDFWIESN